MRPDWGYYGTYDESAHPDLWNGVVGYWAPCLGQTGLRLHDVSRYNNWGTLTNMDAATDWVVDGGQYTLDFDGSNDFVNTGASGGARLVGPPLSVSAWVNGRQLNQSFQGIVSRDQGAPFAFSLRCDSGRVDLITDNATLSSATNLSANAWFHVAVVLGVSLRQIYINGKSSASSTAAYTITANADSLYIGADYNAGSASRLWNGLISDVVIWHRVLTANDVRRHYELGRGGMLERRRRRRVYTEQAGFRAHYATQRNAQLIGGGLR
jgi:hypothetical protein